jgi:hypothetical protein
MKLTTAERNGITAGTFIGFAASYLLSQWGFMPICIAVGYAVGHFWKKA